MGKRIKNEIKRTALSVNSGFKFLSNGPLFILRFIYMVILVIVSILQKILPFFLCIGFFVACYLDTIDSIKDFKISAFFSFSKYIVDSWKAQGKFGTNIFLSVFIISIFEIILFVIKNKFQDRLGFVGGDIWNNEQKIKKNSKKISELHINDKYDSKQDYLKDKAKEFKKSSSYIER